MTLYTIKRSFDCVPQGAPLPEIGLDEPGSDADSWRTSPPLL